MAKQTCSVLFFIGITLIISVLISNNKICSGFLPDNNFSLPSESLSRGLTEEEYDKTLDRFEKIMRPYIRSKAGTLSLLRLWQSPIVNANAESFMGAMVINMFGGLARYPGMTPDAFLLIACHEIGHHLGGAPKLDQTNRNWSTNEGGADYYASLKCMKRILSTEDHSEFLNKILIPNEIQDSCSSIYTEKKDFQICLRTSLASLHIARVFAGFIQARKLPDFNTPDTNQVDQTIDTHPEAQCRLDTYYQASLCPISFELELSSKNYKVHSCYGNQLKTGKRPRCWFKPTDES